MAAEITKQIHSLAQGYGSNPARLNLIELQEQRSQRQMLEVASVMHGADAIEARYSKLGIPLPSVINLFTAGFDKPENAVIVGVCGDETFADFPRPDIYGHAGTISAIGDTTFMNGRAHPNEWAGQDDAAMIIAHPLQVWKEIARRQRAIGIDPLFVFTYLVGTREGHAIKPGDVGLILDDMELTNVVHPGHGARGILDEYFGPHFQPKAGRASNLEMAKLYADFARNEGYINMFPAAVCGTPGTTEYQSFLEVGLLDQAFAQAQAANLGEITQQVFGSLENLSLLYGMGVTAELATMRQTFEGEPDFKVLALGLATDSVGGRQSLVVDHSAVVAAAFAAGEEHKKKLLKFENGYVSHLLQPLPDFSIRAKLITH